jgi:site-specific DNA-methyltransferase (adenine-specific)
LFSFVDDIIFDPFVGSGTTLIAANNKNRYSIGLEIDLKYCELAKQRIINEIGMLF